MSTTKKEEPMASGTLMLKASTREELEKKVEDLKKENEGKTISVGTIARNHEEDLFVIMAEVN